MMQDPIGGILHNYSNSTTKSCNENKCALQLDGVSRKSLAIIHGTKYQKNHKYHEKLCDRILFCSEHGFFVAAVELKGGKSIKMSDAIKQIQNGLQVAAAMLKNHPVREWFPLLLYSGSMHPIETKLLSKSTVTFRHERKNVRKTYCGTKLSSVLSNQE